MSEQTIAAIKQHTTYDTPVGALNVVRFVDLNANDTYKINKESYTKSEFEEAQKKAYELCKIFTDNVDGKRSMSSHIKAWTSITKTINE